ncbi:ribonuclease HII [Pseudoroseicyclus sp. CXY001]|uniref:ribonuclease HII n=1 Tax=Pseudoroseicyclus sp. CXY001 TaxID=3242492 RepID=UPI003570D117
MQILPDYSFETAITARGQVPVAGVDEAGRGPLAGPVVAAAVILDPAAIPPGLNDSKKLSAARRAELDLAIRETAVFAVAEASVEEIDSLNILWASMLAMSRALAALARAPAYALIDGNRLPKEMCCPGEPLIGGDGRSLSIAAASILAKTHRDRVMVDLAQQHPGYGWERNAGYGVKAHQQAIRELGPTPHHRRSFRLDYQI